jgi:hypothetical protein
VQRLLSDGTIDPAFTAGSGALVQGGGISSLVPVGDGTGDIFVGGLFGDAIFGTPADRVPNLVRLNPDGTLDRSSSKPDGTEPVGTMAKAADGTGDLFVVQGSRLTRHKPPTWLSDPQFQIGQFDGRGAVLLPASDNTGDVYLGGEFSSYNGVPVGNIVRIHRDGTVAD